MNNFVFLLYVISIIGTETAGLTEQRVGLDKFVPPLFGCNVNWVLGINGTFCEWCEVMFTALMRELNRAYNPSSIYTDSRDINDKAVAKFDLKGACFINWFVGTSFIHMVSDIQFHRFSAFRNSNWFFFINVCRIFHR